MNKIIFCLFMFCFIGSAIADVSINEFMYNPSGSDNNKEYIEIYSEEFINLSGWIVGDSESEDVLDALCYKNNSYSLVVEEGFDYEGINASIYSVGKTIGNNLNNDWDLILLKDNYSETIDTVSYTCDWGGDNNDKSICRIPDETGIWKECVASGGKSNGKNNQDCDWMVSFVINNSVSEDPEWQIRANKIEGDGKANLTIKHWIENAFGEIIKEYSDIEVENALSQKTSNKYSPALNKGQSYFIKANMTNVSCGDNNLDNNFISIMIFVPDKNDVYSVNSSINIEDVSPNNPEFGETIKIEVNVYRGDTRKYAVYAYVENDEDRVSEKSTMHAKTKFVNYSLTIPVQLKPNCDKGYEEDDYDVIVEGLGVEDRKEIEIEGLLSSLCKESLASSGSSYSKKFEYKVVSKPDEIEAEEDFEIEVSLENNDDEDYDIEMWSYVYRGPKCYSGDREENKKYLELDEKSSRTVRLRNKVEEGAERGDYNVKVKIRKNNQKTLKEITDNIRIIEEVEEVGEEEISDGYIKEEKSRLVKWKEAMIYESTSFKAKKLAPSIFIFALSMVVIILVLTKTF